MQLHVLFARATCSNLILYTKSIVSGEANSCVFVKPEDLFLSVISLYSRGEASFKSSDVRRLEVKVASECHGPCSRLTVLYIYIYIFFVYVYRYNNVL